MHLYIILSMKNYLIILSGGTGSRMHSDIPKQYLQVNGKTILQYTLECFDFSLFEKIVIVVADQWKSFVEDFVSNNFDTNKILFAKAGSSRQESIFNGMTALVKIADAEDIVVIHDGARACLSKDLINRLLEANRSSDGVMPVLPVKDTMYLSKDGKQISSLLNRDEIFSGQAPESFKFGKYYKINKELTIKELENVRGSSEIAFINGMKIALIEGDEANYKITTPQDLNRFKNSIEGR